jgi:Hydrogenase/urease nickel incorporation, metallochaperone, hypA
VHELSIARAVVSTVVDATGGRRVYRVELRLGPHAGVIPGSLTFCWDIVTADTPLEGSVLEFTHVEGPDVDPRLLQVGTVEVADDDESPASPASSVTSEVAS